MTQKTEQQIIKWFGMIMGILLIIGLIFLVVHQIDQFEQQNDPQLDRLRNIFTEFFTQDKQWKYPLDMLNHRNMPEEVNLYKGKKTNGIIKDRVDNKIPTSILFTKII